MQRNWCAWADSVPVGAAFAGLILFASVSMAQFRSPDTEPTAPRPESSVHGELLLPSGQMRGDLAVELWDCQSRMVVARTPASLTGDFMFDSIPIGDYELRVTDTRGDQLHHEFVRVLENMNFFRVTLPEQKVERPVGGTVSVRSLAHKVPKQAVKECHEAQKAAKKGKEQEVIEHLQKAIEIDPEFMEAHNNLGARYMKTNQPDKAVEQFQKAASLDPDCADVQRNLATGLLVLKRYPEAEEAARHAVKLDPTSNRARLLLGFALLSQNHDGQEAVANLQAAALEFPHARLALARVLSAEGNRSGAAEQLKEYLVSNALDHRQEVQTWLAQLQQ